MKVLSYKGLLILKIKFCLKTYYTDGEGEKQQNENKLQISLRAKTDWCEAVPWARGKLSWQSIYSACPATLNEMRLLGGGHLTEELAWRHWCEDLARTSPTSGESRTGLREAAQGKPGVCKSKPLEWTLRKEAARGDPGARPPPCHLSVHHPSGHPGITHSLLKHTRPAPTVGTGISSSFPVRPTLTLKTPFSKRASSRHLLSAWHACSGRASGTRGRSFGWRACAGGGCEEPRQSGCVRREAGRHSRWRTNALQTQGEGPRDGGHMQRRGLQTEAKEVHRHIVPVKGQNGVKKWTDSAILEIGPSIFT